ncbi:MAG TPA: phosphoenolpyruvate-utilizing N-terminal domain-containing protein, partial [Thermoanaerobaculia bacterium]|nr:phosphoenolpyruvate-utilizing N-terminal domain-containing protein [Thermoanaerobaculia bacterium]
MPVEVAFDFPVPGGLHARPASLLRAALQGFPGSATFVNLRSGRTANAKSTLALVATLTRHEDPCVLRIDGAGAEAAADALRRFLRDDLPLSEEPLPSPAHPTEAAAPLPRALSRGESRLLRGVRASGGIARSRAVPVGADERPAHESAERPGTSPEEIAALSRAFAATRGALRARAERAANDTERAILAAHLSILEDPEYRSRIEDEIRSNGVSARRAVRATTRHFSRLLR